MSKRFKVEYQGTSMIMWNVIDTWTGYIYYRGSGTGKCGGRAHAASLNKQWWRYGRLRFKLDAWHESLMNLIFGFQIR